MPGGWDGDAEGVFDGEAVREVVTDSGVAGDAFGEFGAGGVVAAFEEFLDAFVDEPEACLHRDDGLADHGEAEVSGLDEARVYGSDGDLVDASPLDFDERERVAGLVDRGCGAGVVAQGMPVVWPVLVVHETTREAVTDGGDAEQVRELSFETARRERHRGEARDLRIGAIDAHDEFDAIVGAGPGEEVDDADVGVVVVAGDEREPVSRVDERAELLGEFGGVHVDRAA